MVRGMLLSLRRHRWWYPAGRGRAGSEQSPLPPPLRASSPAHKASSLRVREAKVQVWSCPFLAVCPRAGHFNLRLSSAVKWGQ